MEKLILAFPVTHYSDDTVSMLLELSSDSVTLNHRAYTYDSFSNYRCQPCSSALIHSFHANTLLEYNPQHVLYLIRLAENNGLSLADLVTLIESGDTVPTIINWLEANKLTKIDSWEAFVTEQWLERKGTDLLGTRIKNKKAFAKLLKDEYEIIEGNHGVTFVVSLT